MIEKRAYERVGCELESSYTLIDTQPRPVSETVVQDISEGGVRFRANDFISVHDRLILRMKIPGHKPLEVVAQPAWIREVPSVGQFELGAKFISITEEDRAVLRNYAASLKPSRGARAVF